MGWRWGDVYFILLVLAKMLSIGPLASCFTPPNIVQFSSVAWLPSPSAPFILPNCVQHGFFSSLPAHRIKSQCLSRVFTLCNFPQPERPALLLTARPRPRLTPACQRPALSYHWLLTRRPFLLWSTWRMQTPLFETCSNVTFYEMAPPAPKHLPEYFPKFSLSLEVSFSNHKFLIFFRTWL